jgi:opacity protein-like surface antigen
MKKVISIAFVVLMLLSFSFVAQAQSDTKGIYFGLVGGFVIPTDMPSSFTNLTDPTDYANFDVSFKPGYLVGAKVGWVTPFTKKIMALEFEYNHIANDMDKVESYGSSAVDFDAEGKTQIDMFMFNIIGRYPEGRFHPYAGLGLGYALVKIDDMKASYFGLPYFIVGGGSQGVFAYQLMAGLDIDVTKNFIIGIGYKYIDPMKISYDTIYNGVIPVNVEMDYSSHNFTLSFIFMF